MNANFESPMPCECCNARGAQHWMEWGEWLCSECASQAIEDYVTFSAHTKDKG